MIVTLKKAVKYADNVAAVISVGAHSEDTCYMVV